MKPHLLAGGIIALVILCATLYYQTRTPGVNPLHQTPATPSAARHSSSRTTQDPDSIDESQDRLIRAGWDSLLAWLDGSPPPTPEQIRARLRDLRADWAQLDPHVLAAAIESLLQSNVNRPTHLPFAVGPQGFLAGWPDLRTFLVDALAMADPDASVKIARTVLRETNSSSEFAVAIRSLIRGGDSQASPPELLSCLTTLLSRKEWQSDAAMVESLDLARYLGNRDAATALLEWKGNPKARDMALHEFAADHPAVMISTLTDNAANSSPETPALLARADPADPVQAAAIDSYLRNPEVPLDLRKSFLSLYPLRSLTTGYRLYRGNPTPYNESGILRSDEAALAQAETWLKDPALQPLHDSLTAWKQQLLDWRKTEP